MNFYSSVPQGMVFGPTLFLVLIDSLGESEIDSLIMAFADDSKVTRKISNTDDAESLQSDMLEIYTWEKNSNMKFNSSIFHVIQFGRNDELKLDYNYLGPEFQDVIYPAEEVRDLGVTISQEGNYKSHIAKVISKINQKVGYF